MDPAVTTNAIRTGQQQPIKTLEESEPDSGSMVSSDFETFLRLLTTQLENQDPLNPMESSEFAVQLATFSGVEQQVRSNDLLGALVNQADAIGLGEFANWVGMEARSPATLFFDGTFLDLNPTQIPGADRAVLVAKNDLGEILGRTEIPNDGSPVRWLGTGTDGVPLPIGSYNFSIDGYAGQDRISSVPLQTYGTVSEVQKGPSGPILILQDGSRVLASDVTAVRSALAQ